MNTTFDSSNTSRRDRLGRYLGLVWVIVGAFFLFDPYVTVIDILPDCIGYLLVYVGIRRIADLDDRLAEAALGIRRLALLGVARLICTFLAFGFVSHTERPVFILLVLFVFAVLDCMVAIPMWKNVGEGLIYLGSRLDGQAVFARPNAAYDKKHRNITERLVRFSTVFFLAREALAVLPEFSVLTSTAGGADPDAYVSTRYDYIGLMRGMGIAAALVLGVCWLVMLIRYARRLRTDTPFFDRLCEKYRAEVLSRPDLLAMRAVKRAFVWLCVGVALTADFYVDGVNVIPNFLSAVAFLLAALTLRKYASNARPSVIASGVYAVISVGAWVSQLLYFNIEQTPDAMRNEGMYARWTVECGVIAACAVAAVATLALLLTVTKTFVHRYTGFSITHAYHPTESGRVRELHRRLDRRLTVMLVCGVLCAVSTVFHWVGVPLIGEIPPSADIPAFVTMMQQFFVEAYWAVDLAIHLCFLGVSISTTNDIFEQIEYKYLLS